MTDYASKKRVGGRLKAALLGLSALLFFIQFSLWSGVPSGERARPFWIGICVLLFVAAAFGWATWYLFFKPLPAGQPVKAQPIRTSYRQALALLLGVGKYGITIGAFWDEVWHRQYGVPFGEDFFWRPHLLMYFGIIVTVMLAAAGLFVIARRGEGSLQQRFRANPLVGLLVLGGGFLLYALVADPVWHAIYGEDLTAWGIPHLLLWASFSSILLLATAIHMTTEPRRAWGGPAQLSLSDLLPLMLFADLFLMWNQFFVTEWDGGAIYVLTRPEWLLPLLIAGGAAWIGTMANHTLRVFGAATLSGLLALGLRFVLIELFQAGETVSADAWLLAMPSLVLIDLWYAYRSGARIGAGVAAAAGMWLVLLTVFDTFYPLYPVGNLPVAFAMVLVGSLWLSWLGAALGDSFARGSEAEARSAAGSRLTRASRRVAGAMVILVVLFAAFIILFVTTATPPL